GEDGGRAPVRGLLDGRGLSADAFDEAGTAVEISLGRIHGSAAFEALRTVAATFRLRMRRRLKPAATTVCLSVLVVATRAPVIPMKFARDSDDCTDRATGDSPCTRKVAPVALHQRLPV